MVEMNRVIDTRWMQNDQDLAPSLSFPADAPWAGSPLLISILDEDRAPELSWAKG